MDAEMAGGHDPAQPEEAGEGIKPVDEIDPVVETQGAAPERRITDASGRLREIAMAATISDAFIEARRRTL